MAKKLFYANLQFVFQSPSHHRPNSSPLSAGKKLSSFSGDISFNRWSEKRAMHPIVLLKRIDVKEKRKGFAKNDTRAKDVVLPLADKSKGSHFKCLLCDYSTSDINTFEAHQNEHLKNDVLTPNSHRVSSKNKKFKCSRCSYGVNNRFDFKLHTWRHVGYKPFKCRKCDYKTDLFGKLKKHELDKCKVTFYSDVPG